jgi:hypothetical protein
MTTATEAQKMRLAEASLRLAREALRGVPTDLGVSTRKCTLCPFHENKRGIQRAFQSG